MLSTYQSQIRMPRRVVQLLDGIVKPIRGEACVAFAHNGGELREHPAILGSQRLGLGRIDVQISRVATTDFGDEEAVGHLPQLVGKTLIGRDAVLVEAHVLPAGANGCGPGADRVGAVLVDEVERVDDVTFRLAHPAPIGRLDRARDEDVGERVPGGELDAEHDHSSDPEEDDVASGHQQVSRVEPLQLRRLLGPSEDGERP